MFSEIKEGREPRRGGSHKQNKSLGKAPNKNSKNEEKSHWNKSLKDAKRPSPRHVIIKMPKVKGKERTLKAAREKQFVT